MQSFYTICPDCKESVVALRCLLCSDDTRIFYVYGLHLRTVGKHTVECDASGDHLIFVPQKILA